jgi:nickel transport protein
MDFTLTAETTDGHLAEWKVRANELPEFLPPPDVWREGASNPTSADVKNENLQLRMMIREELKPLVAQFTRRSERLERILNEVRWRDVVGGIGYLVGITGIVCYLKRGKSQRQG